MMEIELYSVKGFTGSALKQKLEKAMKVHQLPHTISEINHVDRFIKAGLVSVPAIRMGNKVIQHRHENTPDETVEHVMAYLLSDKPASILVPVDFSEESKHGIDYANMMAENMDLGMTLVHVHQTVYDPISAGAMDIQIVQESQKQLADLTSRLNADNKAKGIKVPVQSLVEVGDPSDSLIELLEDGPYEMMIMATKATDNMFRRLFGTISSDVSRNSQKPVVVVPPQARIKFPGKVIVGFTEELFLDDSLESILRFGAKNNMFFDFVHIAEHEEGFAELKSKLYEKLVTNRQFLCGFNIRVIKHEEYSIQSLLFEYAHEVRAGMVVFVTHHRSFLESLLRRSITKRALMHPQIPVMVVHHGS